MDKFLESIITKDYMQAEKEFRSAIAERIKYSVDQIKQEVSKSLFESKKIKMEERDDNDNGVEDDKEQLEEGITVKSKDYSWGKMKTISKGADFSIPLHPEHQEAITKLNDGDFHTFKDETGSRWTAKRAGNDIHFSGGNKSGFDGNYKAVVSLDKLKD